MFDEYGGAGSELGPEDAGTPGDHARPGKHPPGVQHDF